MPIVGGIASAKQERLLKQNPEIVVATPGRLWELMRDGNHHLSNMTHLSFLVLDEADRMVQQGHFEVRSIRLNFLLPFLLFTSLLFDAINLISPLLFLTGLNVKHFSI